MFLPNRFTDSTGGTAGVALAAGVGQYVMDHPITLANVADGDVMTDLVINHAFKIIDLDFVVTTKVTTASKATTLNLAIGSTDLTGGAVALTSDNCTPIGAVIAGTAITANNTGAAGDKLSIKASSTTAFSEGEGVLRITIQNLDTANAIASLASHMNNVLDTLSEQL